jgi:hypothetical protein
MTSFEVGLDLIGVFGDIINKEFQHMLRSRGGYGEGKI